MIVVGEWSWTIMECNIVVGADIQLLQKTHFTNMVKQI